MDVVTFKPEHLRALRLQPAQAWCAPHLTDGLLEETAALEAYTALVEGQPIACAGFLPFWEGRSMVWSYLGENAGSYMFGLTREVQRRIEAANLRRVEAYIDPDFFPAIRWIELLGFHCEGLLRSFMPDGKDQLLYVRLGHG